MQVVFVAGGTDYVLAHGADRAVNQHVGPDDTFSHDCAGLVQVDPIIGAAYRKLYDRGNLLSTINFGVQVQKATSDAGLEFKSTYPVTLPRYGVLEFRLDSGAKVRFATAHIERVSCAPVGVCVNVRYSISAVSPTVIPAP